jgi:hypothetical protein
VKRTIRGIVIAGALVALSAPAWAQQLTPENTPEERSRLNAARNQVLGYEEMLRQAIDRAAQQLNDWANKQAPVILQPAVKPAVHGMFTPEGGATFTIELAAELRGVELWLETRRMLQVDPSTSGRTNVSAAGVVKGDPMTGPPPVVLKNPDEAYSSFVRESLIDVLLDNSRLLSISAGQSLTIQAIPVSVIYTGPFEGTRSRRLQLSIKGEDLSAFHAGKITRDEAKQKISETRF